MQHVKVPKLSAWYYLLLPFLCAYDAATVTLKLLQPTPWLQDEKDQTGKFNLRIGETFPLQNMKAIKSHFKVSFESVITTLISGAIRETMLKQGVTLPETMSFTWTILLPRSNVKLRNIM